MCAWIASGSDLCRLSLISVILSCFFLHRRPQNRCRRDSQVMQSLVMGSSVPHFMLPRPKRQRSSLSLASTVVLASGHMWERKLSRRVLNTATQLQSQGLGSKRPWSQTSPSPFSPSSV